MSASPPSIAEAASGRRAAPRWPASSAGALPRAAGPGASGCSSRSCWSSTKADSCSRSPTSPGWWRSATPSTRGPVDGCSGSTGSRSGFDGHRLLPALLRRSDRRAWPRTGRAGGRGHRGGDLDRRAGPGRAARPVLGGPRQCLLPRVHRPLHRLPGDAGTGTARGLPRGGRRSHGRDTFAPPRHHLRVPALSSARRSFHRARIRSRSPPHLRGVRAGLHPDDPLHRGLLPPGAGWWWTCR